MVQTPYAHHFIAAMVSSHRIDMDSLRVVIRVKYVRNDGYVKLRRILLVLVSVVT